MLLTPDLILIKIMNDIIKNKTDKILAKLKDVLKNALVPLDEYYNSFPEEIKLGLISFKSRPVDIKLSYFTCASKTVNTVLAAESCLSSLPAVMIEADRCADIETVMSCDKLLVSFEELRRSLNTFTLRSEKLLSEDTLSYSGLLNVFSEFRIKLVNYIEYVNSFEF